MWTYVYLHAIQHGVLYTTAQKTCVLDTEGSYLMLGYANLLPVREEMCRLAFKYTLDSDFQLIRIEECPCGEDLVILSILRGLMDKMSSTAAREFIAAMRRAIGKEPPHV